MIILEASWWYVLLCLLIAFIITGILYYKNGTDMSKRLLWGLSMLRFTAVFLIASLLLSPILKSTKERVEMPIIVVAHDNSKSVALGKDSLFVKRELNKRLDEMKKSLEEVAMIEEYTFGSEVKQSNVIDFKEKKSDYASLISEVKDIYYNRNIAAVVVVGDGISNAGNNPLYVSDDLPFSIHSIALGDTIIKRDVSISKVTSNDITYKGNKFPLEVIIESKLLKGKKGDIRISNNGKILETRGIAIDADDYYSVQTFNIDAANVGIQRYDISVTTFEEEQNISNNHRVVYINVLEEKQNIAIIASTVHPDVGALNRSLSSNINYAVETFIGTTNVDLDKFDAVILHQIPDKKGLFNGIINKIKGKDIPTLVIIGSNTSLIDLNKMGIGINIASRGSLNESLPVFNTLFSAFKVREETQKLIAMFPPLMSPLGNYNIDKKAIIMINQRIGSYATDMPMFMFSEGAESRYGIITGENIWRWRLFCYDKMENFEAFDELMSKTVQYLVTINDKSKFRIKCEKNISIDNDMFFTGELYNDNYELINDVEVFLNLKDDNDGEYNYTMNSTSNGNYTLNVGKLASGVYKYKAKCDVGNKKHEVNGEFIVSNIDLETVNTVANHKLLSRLAEKYNGIVVYPDDINHLVEHIKKQSDLKPVSYTSISYDYITDKWWILVLIITLLSTEWFLRKWGGQL